MTTLAGKLADWFRHASSSPTLVPVAEPSHGPEGGIANDLRFDIGATSALQRAAYSNTRLGALRGAGLVSLSMLFSTGATRSKVAVLGRWNPGRLEAPDACYAAEILYDSTGMHCTLRGGPDESGEILFQKRLKASFGFVGNRWLEVGLVFSLDSVGNLKLQTVARPNTERGVSTVYTTYPLTSTTWYSVGTALVLRHLARESGNAGWQVLSRTESGSPFVRIGGFRAVVEADPPMTILPDVITE